MVYFTKKTITVSDLHISAKSDKIQRTCLRDKYVYDTYDDNTNGNS